MVKFNRLFGPSLEGPTRFLSFDVCSNDLLRENFCLPSLGVDEKEVFLCCFSLLLVVTCFMALSKQSTAGESSIVKSITSQKQTDLSGTSSAIGATLDKLE